MKSKHSPLTPHVSFAQNRLFITFTLFLLIGLPSSLLPEENYGTWLWINFMLAVFLTIINHFIWMRQKHDSKRYFWFHSLVMLAGLAFYVITPLFRVIYPSISFWILLAGVLVYVLFIFSKYDAIGGAIINPRKKGFKLVIFAFFSILLLAGSSVWAFMLGSDAAPVNGLAVFFFLMGIFFLTLAPAMLVTPERAEELAQAAE